jgi:ribosomal protein S18 acetylase RimI-like enzyme
MRTRPLEPAEIPALARALAEVPLMIRYRRDASALERSLAAAHARGEGLVVADDGGSIRGLAWFLREGTLAMGGYLKLIAMLPGAEGKGIGAQLLAAFEAETSARSAHAFLLVSDFNAEAQRFYERHGYARVGTLPALVLADVAELVYWKRLR